MTSVDPVFDNQLKKGENNETTIKKRKSEYLIEEQKNDTQHPFSCQACKKEYITQLGLDKHICPHGKCGYCFISHKKYKEHEKKCLKNPNYFQRYKQPLDSTPYICEKCGQCGFREDTFNSYRNQLLCRRCSFSRELQIERERLTLIVHQFLIGTNRTKCCFCHEIVVDASNSDPSPRLYEHDHINPFLKNYSVGTLVWECEKEETILAELQLCRILCIFCHSALTHAQYKVGLVDAIHLKNHTDKVFTPDEQQIFLINAEKEAKLLLKGDKK